MTVKELIERLQKENPDALVYTAAHDDDIAIIVTEIRTDALEGTDKTVTMIF